MGKDEETLQILMKRLHIRREKAILEIIWSQWSERRVHYGMSRAEAQQSGRATSKSKKKGLIRTSTTQMQLTSRRRDNNIRTRRHSTRKYTDQASTSTTAIYYRKGHCQNWLRGTSFISITLAS